MEKPEEHEKVGRPKAPSGSLREVVTSAVRRSPGRMRAELIDQVLNSGLSTRASITSTISKLIKEGVFVQKDHKLYLFGMESSHGSA